MYSSVTCFFHSTTVWDALILTKTEPLSVNLVLDVNKLQHVHQLHPWGMWHGLGLGTLTHCCCECSRRCLWGHGCECLQGTQYYWHFGPDDPWLWGAVLGTTESLAASLASPHKMPVASPSPRYNSQECLQILPNDSWGTKSPHGERLPQESCLISSA